MKTNIIALITCIIASPLFAIDMDNIQAQLGSDDYAARKKARIELQLALADATKPETNGQERKAMENTILAQIKSNLPLSERLYLIRMLELFGSAEMAASLNELLSDKDQHVSDSARRALASIPGDAATNYLLAVLEKAPATEQGAYLQALAYRRDANAVAKMTRFLQSDNATLVATTALALSKAGKVEQIPAIKKALAKAPATTKPAIEAAMITLGLDSKTARSLTESGSNPSIQAAAFVQLLSLDAKGAEAYLTRIVAKTDLAARSKILNKAILLGSPSIQAHLVKALPSAPLDAQIIILSAIGEIGLSEYEAPLIAMLDNAKGQEQGELQNTLIDTLSHIGGEASFDPINKALIADPNNKKTITAISQLKAPNADKKILLTAKDSKNTNTRIAAIQLLALRNIPGSADLLNSIASTATDKKVKDATLKALETTGNEKSLRIFVKQILSTTPADKDGQRSLKRISQHLGGPQAQWDNIYSPALKSAVSDKHRESLILIIDGIPCQGSLNYLTDLALNATSTLQPTAIRTLQRWPSIDVGNAWLTIASCKEATATSQSGLKKWLSKNERGLVNAQMKLLAKTIKDAPNAEFKRDILSVYIKPNPRIKKQLKKTLTPLKNDPDVGEQVKTILKRL